MDFRADLHCHSNCSDGTDTPEELLESAVSKGLSGLSITDHDTVDAYTDILFAKAQKLGLRLGTGVELSCKLDRFSVHILGYNMDVDHPAIKEFCTEHQKNRYERNLKVCEKLERLGMPIGALWLYDDGVPKRGLGRPHIAKKMIDKGYVGSVQEAFSRYLGEGKAAYLPSSDKSIPESIDVIHQAGGKAFIAHPHLIRRRGLIAQIKEMDFDGVECYYAGQTLNPWLEIAKEKSWLISGGSDYHGVVKPESRLGSSYVTGETYKAIFDL